MGKSNPSWPGFQAGNTPKTRMPKDQVVMSQAQFCKWLAKEKGISSEVLRAAMKVIGEGMLLATTRGYRVMWRGLMSIELRETKERQRYHRIRKEMYTQPPFCRVHIKAASDLNKRVRALAKEEVDKAVRQIPLAYPGQE